jgi:hypothetical protein
MLLLRTEIEIITLTSLRIASCTVVSGQSPFLPPFKFVLQSLKGLHGLYKIKASYRVRKL